MLWIIHSRKVPRIVLSAETDLEALAQFRDGMSAESYKRLTAGKSFKCEPLTLEMLEEMVKASCDKGLYLSDDTSF